MIIKRIRFITNIDTFEGLGVEFGAFDVRVPDNSKTAKNAKTGQGEGLTMPDSIGSKMTREGRMMGTIFELGGVKSSQGPMN